MSNDPNEEFLPFSRPSISQAAIDEVVTCLRSGWITTGPRVKQFEDDLKTYLGAPHVLALTSATAGLHLVLTALNLKPGDEVITTPRTFIASASCIIARGAVPVFADVDPDSQNITAETIQPHITSRTRAIMLVSFNGRAPDMERAVALARRHRLFLVEDAAQALGSRWRGRHLAPSHPMRLGLFRCSPGFPH